MSYVKCRSRPSSGFSSDLDRRPPRRLQLRGHCPGNSKGKVLPYNTELITMGCSSSTGAEASASGSHRYHRVPATATRS